MRIDPEQSQENLKQLFKKYDINPAEYSSLSDAMRDLWNKMPQYVEWQYAQKNNGNYGFIGTSLSSTMAGSSSFILLNNSVASAQGITISEGSIPPGIIINPTPYSGGT